MPLVRPLVAIALALAPALATNAQPLDPPQGPALAPPAAIPPAEPVAVAPPAPRTPRIQLAAKFGFDLGFTDLLKVELTDGSTRAIVANQGVFLGVGASVLPVWNGRVRTEATLGVKYTGIEASNGSADLLVFPLEVVETVRLDPVRVGVGFEYLYRPKMTGSGVLSQFNVGFESTLGLLVQAEWLFPTSRGAWTIGPRFLWQRFQVRGGGAVVDANALGLVASLIVG